MSDLARKKFTLSAERIVAVAAVLLACGGWIANIGAQGSRIGAIEEHQAQTDKTMSDMAGDIKAIRAVVDRLDPARHP